MPYRKSAAKRKTVKTELKLDNNEVNQAIRDFLEERGLLPEGVDPACVEVEVFQEAYAGIGRNTCYVRFEHDVLSLVDSQNQLMEFTDEEVGLLYRLFRAMRMADRYPSDFIGNADEENEKLRRLQAKVKSHIDEQGTEWMSTQNISYWW